MIGIQARSADSVAEEGGGIEAKRFSIRKVQEVLWLGAQGLPDREPAQRVKVLLTVYPNFKIEEWGVKVSEIRKALSEVLENEG